MFRVGVDRYLVRVTDAPIVVDGTLCLGTCDESEHTVRLSPTLPVSRRLNILLHELIHAHVYAAGFPRDLESLCDFAATAAELAFRDLMSAGGEEALKRLGPGETLGRPAGRIGLLRSRSCRCGGLVAPGEILCEADPLAPDQVKLFLYCEHCDATQIWNEQMTFGGLPSGVVVGEPKIERGRTITLPCPA